MLIPGFSEIDGRVIGLVSLEYVVDFASKAGHKLMMNEFYHAV